MTHAVDEQVEQFATLLANARGRTMVLTGAGISTESGLPDFRGSSGLWRNQRFEQLASINALLSDPEEFWEFYRLRLDTLTGVEPNAAHVAITRLQRAGYVSSVATQNVDGLHQAAGTQHVLELHGSLRCARCRRCGTEVPMAEARRRWSTHVQRIPECDCGAVMGPGVVLFGEALPLAMELAIVDAEGAQLVLALGTSLEVYPAAHVPIVAVERGGQLGIINRTRTEFDSLAVAHSNELLGTLLPKIADAVHA